MELPVLRTRTVPDGLERDLRAAVRGDVRFGAHDRMLYATDASIYQVEPLGVVVPADVDDAANAMRVCAKAGVAILPRGGGTSLAGQCTNRAVVIDLSPNCQQVLSVDAAAGRVRVEPGVTIDELNEHLTGLGGAAAGLFFAPDPATSRQANIGGCIGNNAAGARSVRYGRTSENVIVIDACLADGTRVHLDEGAASRDANAARLTRGVCEIVAKHAALIRERFPKTIRRNAGYNLDMVLAAMERSGWRDGQPITDAAISRVNLAHLLCGSEGTLALTLGAELALHPRPKAKGLAILAFASLDEAIAAVLPILTTKPTAVELLDDTVIDLARANAGCRPLVALMPTPTRGDLRAVLYVEYFGESTGEVAERLSDVRHVVPGVAMQTHTDAKAMAGAWQLRKSGEPLLHGIAGSRKPITFVEDNAVPVEHLSQFVRELRAVVEAHGTRAAFYAHASVGVLHVRPLIDLHDMADRERMRSIAVAASDLAKSLGGVMSGEHGDGRVRTPMLERFYGPELMAAFREVKRLFDPANLLNPGNIVDLSGSDPRPIESITANLRADAASHAPVVETYFDFADQHGLHGAAEACNGAGVCRKKQGGTMCPSYMATLDERHSTRGRGNALRLAISGQLSSGMGGTGVPPVHKGLPAWNDPNTIETLDLCLSCKACKNECPSNVDIARLKAEYTAQRYRTSGVPFGVGLMGHIRSLNRMGSVFPTLANAISRFAPVRAVINAVMGLHPKRSLPVFSRSLAGQWGSDPAAGRAGSPRVVLFGDCFTMFNEPGIGLATKRVFEAFGYGVQLADAGCCGRAKISLGLLPQAIEEIEATLARLRALVDDPSVIAILVAEPSCLSAMKDDWLGLKLRTPLEVRKRLAAKAFLPEEFLDAKWNAHPRRPAFAQPAESVLLHAHCHQKALWGAESSAGLLRRVLGDNLRVLDTGCCGMAGSFGYAAHRYKLSQQIGELTLFPAVRASPTATVCAPGTSCRHQVRDALETKPKHPMEVVSSLLVPEG